jgi:hypothetical protein
LAGSVRCPRLPLQRSDELMLLLVR